MIAVRIVRCASCDHVYAPENHLSFRCPECGCSQAYHWSNDEIDGMLRTAFGIVSGPTPKLTLWQRAARRTRRIGGRFRDAGLVLIGLREVD